MITTQEKHMFININNQTINENRKTECVKVQNENLADNADMIC